MKKNVVSDTGPFISLEKLDNGFDIIRSLFDKIIVPSKVIEEIAEYKGQNYLRKYEIEDLVEVHQVEFIPNIPGIKNLHEAEAQAISLALELNLPLLIEELKGRNIAYVSNIKFSGIAKQIVVAYKTDVINVDEAKKDLKALLDNNRINKRVYDALFMQINK